MTKKLLIVEEALRDLKAHWFEYIQTIKEAVNERGWEVEVAVHKDAAAEITRTFNCFPIFRNARYLRQEKDKLPAERYYGFLLHSLRCLRVLWPFFKKHRYDAVFVPTVLVHHLLAWYIIMRLHPDKPAHLTLFFVTPPGVWDDKRKMTDFPKSTIILKKLLQLFRQFIIAGKVTLAAETREARNQFEKVSGLPFTLMPHPVPFNDTATDNTSAKIDMMASGRQQPVSFGCFGFARHEKGADLLKAAIEKILASNSDFPAHFTIQWTDPFTMPDGSICTPGCTLESHPQVTIVDRPLASNEYKALLLKTDCMILPYRNSSYHARVSRIAIEAACNSIPIIYTKGGWLEENAENFGAGVGIADESPDELISAIQTVCYDFKKFSNQAKDSVQKARAYYDPGHFSRLLLNVGEPVSAQLL